LFGKIELIKGQIKSKFKLRNKSEIQKADLKNLAQKIQPELY